MTASRLAGSGAAEEPRQQRVHAGGLQPVRLSSAELAAGSAVAGSCAATGLTGSCAEGFCSTASSRLSLGDSACFMTAKSAIAVSTPVRLAAVAGSGPPARRPPVSQPAAVRQFSQPWPIGGEGLADDGEWRVGAVMRLGRGGGEGGRRDGGDRHRLLSAPVIDDEHRADRDVSHRRGREDGAAGRDIRRAVVFTVKLVAVPR